MAAKPMSPEERRAFARGYSLARLQMSRQLRATKMKFDADIDELRLVLEDIRNDIVDLAADAGINANADRGEVVLH